MSRPRLFYPQTEALSETKKIDTHLYHYTKYPKGTWELGILEFGYNPKSELEFENIQNWLNMLIFVYIYINVI